MPKVTVLMLVYNEEDRIERALASLIDQDYRDFELLIADDFSTDRSIEIAKQVLKFSGVPEWSILHSTSHLGMALNIDRAFLEIHGEFICRLDADDELTPQALGRLVDAWEPGTFVYGNYLEFKSGFGKLIKPANIYQSLACGVLLKKQDVIKAGGLVRPEVGVFVEYDLYARLESIGVQPKYLDEIVYYYYRHQGSVTTQKDDVDQSLENLQQYWGSELVEQVRHYD